MGEWKGTCEVEIGLNDFVPSRPVLPPSLLPSIPPSPPTLQLKQGFFPVPLQVVQVLPPSGLACRRAIPLVKEGREGGREGRKSENFNFLSTRDARKCFQLFLALPPSLSHLPPSLSRF